MKDLIKEAEKLNAKRLEEWKLEKICQLLAKKEARISEIEKEIKEVTACTKLKYDQGSTLACSQMGGGTIYCNN